MLARFVLEQICFYVPAVEFPPVADNKLHSSANGNVLNSWLSCGKSLSRLTDIPKGHFMGHSERSQFLSDFYDSSVFRKLEIARASLKWDEGAEIPYIMLPLYV